MEEREFSSSLMSTSNDGEGGGRLALLLLSRAGCGSALLPPPALHATAVRQSCPGPGRDLVGLGGLCLSRDCAQCQLGPGAATATSPENSVTMLGTVTPLDVSVIPVLHSKSTRAVEYLLLGCQQDEVEHKVRQGELMSPWKGRYFTGIPGKGAGRRKHSCHKESQTGRGLTFLENAVG